MLTRAKKRGVINMYLENGRVLMQGIMLLVSAAIAYFVSLPIGLALVAFIGVSKLQESVTDWCPSDLFLRPMGLKKKVETKQSE
jgi:hypothetical protein